MTKLALFAAMTLTIATPLLLHFGLKLSGRKMKYAMVGNIICFAVICIGTTLLLIDGGSVMAEAEGAAAAVDSTAGFAYIGAALATGLASIGAGIAVAAAASAAIGAISEDPGIMGKALIFVALAEGIALYGLLISFMIIGNL
jgi:V/A-type H+-transporting ATPase subunit K